jgi:hypothetical protein
LKNNITSLFSLLGDRILPLGDQKKVGACDHRKVFFLGGGGDGTKSPYFFKEV